MPKGRKPTNAELIARVKMIDTENFILRRALQAATNGKVEWYATAEEFNQDGPGLYYFGLVDRDSAHGGILLIRYCKEGQHDHTEASFLEDKMREINELQRGDPSNRWYQMASSPIRQAHQLAVKAYEEKRK